MSLSGALNTAVPQLPPQSDTMIVMETKVSGGDSNNILRGDAQLPKYLNVHYLLNF